MSEPLSPAQVAEIRARAEKATPGDIGVYLLISPHAWALRPSKGLVPDKEAPAIGEFKELADAAFYAHARTDVPALCDSYDAQARKLEACESFNALRERLLMAQAAEIERLKADADASHKHLTGLLADAKVNIDRMQAIIEADEAENARLKAKLAEAARDSARLNKFIEMMDRSDIEALETFWDTLPGESDNMLAEVRLALDAAMQPEQAKTKGEPV